MTVFRGLAVPAKEYELFESDIRANGIIEPFPSSRSYSYQDNRRLLSLVDDSSLATALTRANRTTHWVCACGDEGGACFYANRSYQNSLESIPVTIEMDISLSEILLDGNDFLYSVFQRVESIAPIYDEIVQTFGSAIVPYLDLALKVDSDRRFALCDLAVSDESVISLHYKNSRPIGGKAGTAFCSAFACPTPIKSSSIIDVRIARLSKIHRETVITIRQLFE